jgi:hypothetical protein
VTSFRRMRKTFKTPAPATAVKGTSFLSTDRTPGVNARVVDTHLFMPTAIVTDDVTAMTYAIIVSEVDIYIAKQRIHGHQK